MCELGESMFTAGDLAGAEGTLSDAAERAEAAGLRALQLRARLALLNLQAFGTRTASADDLLEAALTAIPTLTQPRGRPGTRASVVLRLLGPRRLPLPLRRGGARCTAGPLPLPESRLAHCGCASSVLAASVYFGPTPVPEAVSDCIALLTDADVNGRANVLAHLAGLRAMQGDFDRARQELLEARSLFTEIGQGAHAEILCGADRGGYRAARGRRDPCARAARGELLGTGALGKPRLTSRLAKAVLADVLYRRGRVAEADELARDAQAHSSPDDVPTQSDRANRAGEGARAPWAVRRGRAARRAGPGSPRRYGHPEPESGLPAGLRRGAGVGRTDRPRALLSSREPSTCTG